MSEEYSLSDSAVDAIVSKFLRDNEDLEIELIVRYLPDLGFQTIITTGGDQRAISGHPDSPTRALEQLIPRAEKSVSKFREYQDKIEAAFADEDDD